MEVIKIKKISDEIKKFGKDDLLNILSNHSIIILSIIFPMVLLTHYLSSYQSQNSIQSLLLFTMNVTMSLFLFNFGVLLTRKIKRGQDVGFVNMIMDSTSWIVICIRFNLLKFILGLVLSIGSLFLLSNVGYATIIFLIIFVVIGKGLVSLYMMTDGVVYKLVKGQEKVSSSLTVKRVSEYKNENRKTNQNTYLAISVIFSFLLIVSNFKPLLMPFVVFSIGLMSYLIYEYSYEKIKLDLKASDGLVLVKGYGEDVDVEEDVSDISIGELKAESKKINRLDGNGGLSKEKILGEHWYLNDKPSIIKKEEDLENDEDVN